MIALLLATPFVTVACSDDDEKPGDKVVCDQDCSTIAGAGEQICVSVGGKSECKPICHGDKVGDNAPVCGVMSVANEISYVSVCAKDDFGTLYTTNFKKTECEANEVCDNDTGLCKSSNSNDKGKCDPDCSTIVGAGAQICVTVGGKSECKRKCHGDREGVNAPVCNLTSINAQASYVMTCAKDDDGQLYATNVEQTICNDGVQCNDETGRCEDIQ